MFTIFAGIYHWFPKMTGRMYDERPGPDALLADPDRDAGHVRADALDRDGGDAAPRRRLRGPVRRLEPVDLDLRVHPRRRPADLPLQHGRQLEVGPRAGANPWRAKTIEWLVSSPPPVFNFDEIPRVVGGPYEFGVPGARHAIMAGEEGAEVSPPKPAVAGATRRGAGLPLQPLERAARDPPPLLNEVAGGRKLLEAIRERVDAGRRERSPSRRPRTSRWPARSSTATSWRRGPQPGRGDPGGLRRVRDRGGGRRDGPRSAARARRRDPRLRALRGPALVPHRDPLRPDPQATWSSGRGGTSRIRITHIPVRIDDDAIRWDVTHTLVVATQTVASADLVGRLKSRAESARTATRSSARAPASSAARRSATGSPAPSPRSTARRSTPPASR